MALPSSLCNFQGDKRIKEWPVGNIYGVGLQMAYMTSTNIPLNTPESSWECGLAVPEEEGLCVESKSPPQ